MDEVIVRSLQGDTTSEEEAALADWRRASPDNERHYARIAAVWALTGRIKAPVPSHKPPTFRDVQGVLEDQTGRVLSLYRAAPRSRWGRWSLTAAALLVVAVGAMRLVGRTRMSDVRVITEHTNHGVDVDSLRLNDGSVVLLGPGARMQASVIHADRQVWLDGAAEFAVAKKDGRVFTVHTAAGEARVLGTRFVVRAENIGMQLMVLEGRVAVSGSGGTEEVKPGQSGLVLEGMRPVVTTLSTTRPSADWLRAALVFEAVPLEQVAVVIARRYGVRVVIRDTILAKRTFTAWFVQLPTAAQILTGVCRTSGVRCLITDSVAVIGSR